MLFFTSWHCDIITKKKTTTIKGFSILHTDTKPREIDGHVPSYTVAGFDFHAEITHSGIVLKDYVILPTINTRIRQS